MIHGNNTIYLDHSATTPLDPAVADVIASHMKSTFGNASSLHSFGRLSKVILEESRESIAGLIGAESSEIFFTSGGTESDNQALIGAAFHHRKTNGKNRVLISSIEHHAVLDAANYLKESGFIIDVIPVDAAGVVNPSDIEKMMTDSTAIVSVMHANNETGAVQPIAAIAEITKKSRVPFHSDAVQTFGKIPIDVNALGVDLLAISAHKINGPKGIGAIYIRKGTGLDPILFGGAQERKMRPGTENIPLIAGFAKASVLAEENRETLYRSAEKFYLTLKKNIQEQLDGIIFNSGAAVTLPHICSVSLDSDHYGSGTDSLLITMDLHGIAVSSGSACTSGSVQPSHVLLAMGRNRATTEATVRFSFGKFTTIDEVTKAGEIFCSIVRSIPKKEKH